MGLKTDLIGVWCEGATPQEDQFTNALTLTNNNTVTTVAGKIGTAGLFEKDNSEYLNRADEANLSTGDISWTEAVWVQDRAGAGDADNRYISNKGDERVLLYRKVSSENRFRIYIANFAVGLAANTFGEPSVETWYYLQAQHDAASNKLRIRVNNGAWDEVTTGGTAPTDDAQSFYIGAYGNAGSPILFWDGYLNQFAFWKALKSDADLNAIYNAGNGLPFARWDADEGIEWASPGQLFNQGGTTRQWMASDGEFFNFNPAVAAAVFRPQMFVVT